MYSVCLRWIVIFQVFYIGACADLQSIWDTNFDDQASVSRRSDESVWAEGVPLWLEQKRMRSAYPSHAFGDDRLRSVWENQPLSMEDREEEQLERLRRVMRGEAVPYEYYRAGDSSGNQEIGLVRRAKGNEFLLAHGFRHNASWLPIAVGLSCLLLVALTIFGSMMFYYKIYLPKKSMGSEFDESGNMAEANSGLIGYTADQTTTDRVEGDRKLAHSAQMYHYQHQKQQMLAVERANGHLRGSEDGSESDAEETDFTVYECPALTEPGELEVQNPLFDDPTNNHEASANGSSGEIIHANDLDDHSDSTPTPRVNNSFNLSLSASSPSCSHENE